MEENEKDFTDDEEEKDLMKEKEHTATEVADEEYEQNAVEV